MSEPDKKIADDVATSDPESPFAAAVEIELQDSIDLHHFQPKDISSVVEEYLAQCRQARLLEVRLIHGKGVGVQRNIIRALLSKHPAVLSFQDAPAEAGGWGATVVVLRKSD
jgi:DNA-nicking Smr family endonuclease